MSNPILDYETLNAMAIRALAAQKRILEAHINHVPAYKVVEIDGKQHPVDTRHPGDPVDQQIIAQWQHIIIAMGQLNFADVARALAAIKERL